MLRSPASQHPRVRLVSAVYSVRAYTPFNAQHNVKMGRRLDPILIQRVRILHAEGLSQRKIYKATGVDPKTQRALDINYKVYGQPYAPRTVVQGRPRKLLKYQEDVSRSFFASRDTDN